MKLAHKLILLSGIVLLLCAKLPDQKINLNHVDHSEKEEKMVADKTTQKKKEIIRRLYEDCLNQRNFDLLDEFIAEEYGGVRGERGPSGFEKTVQSIIQAFPDIQWKIEDLIAEENKVVVRWSWQGTHTGTFRGFLPPTQKQITDHAIAIYQFRDHKIVKAWIQSDRLGFLQQLGMIPRDLRSLPSPQEE